MNAFDIFIADFSVHMPVEHIKEDKKMKEVFESVIENVSEIEFSGHSDPEMRERVIEVWAKSGEDAYMYKFKGPGVALNVLSKIDMENEELKEKIKKLEHDNALNKETADTWSKEYYNLSKKFDKLQEEYKLLEDRGCNANIHGKDYTLDQLVDHILELEEENERIKENIKSQHKLTIGLDQKNHELQEEIEERTVNSVAAKEKNKLLEIENNKLREDNLFLMEQNQMLSEGNKDLRQGFDKVTKRAEELRKQINESNGLQYPITRERVLEQAKECVCGHREQDYGTPESNFKIISDLWNDYLGLAENGDGVPIFSIKNITPTDVSMMMALMKIARIRNGGGSGDSFVDLAGYAACGGEIWHGERHSGT